jgi:hypothetical protein
MQMRRPDPSKQWSLMTASERMAAKLEYLRRNLGPVHVLTLAAESGDVQTFRRHASAVPIGDPTIAAILDATK